MNYWHLAGALLSAFGLGLCLRIFKKKREPKPMVCMLGADCNKVVKSEFSTFMGVGLEFYGIGYYALSLLFYASAFLWPHAFALEAKFIATGFAMTAFLFSCYLTFVQAFYIKSWCSWCLTSAATSTIIFLLAVGGDIAAGLNFVPLLLEWREALVALHLLGFALGIGGATVADLVFFRFMKDFYISESERDIIRSLSQALWFGLLIVAISAIGLYLPAQAGQASYFWPEMALLFLIAVNDALLGLLVMPRLVAAASNHKVLRVAEVSSLRRIAFALGSASFVTWYAAFAAVLRGDAGIDVGAFFGWYIAAMVGAIVFSQMVERRYHAIAPSMAAF